MKKLLGPIVAALILVTGMLLSVSVYIYFSPVQTCMRSYADEIQSPEDRAFAQRHCSIYAGGRN